MMTKATNSFRNKKVLVHGVGLPGSGIATANWFLDQGAYVTVTDVKSVKRIEEHLKKNARDGQEYEKSRARLLTHTGKTPAGMDLVIQKPEDDRELFCRVWPRKIIGITGAHGKTTTALWAAHLIGDAVVVGHDPEKSPMVAVNSRAKVAVVEGTTSQSGKTVSTDDENRLEVPNDFGATWGKHNVNNLKTAMHIARLAGGALAEIHKRIATLPVISYRQEVVHRDRKLAIINDTTATTPEAAIAAFQQWGGPNCILIAGGTDQRFEYATWASELPKYITANNTIFMSGTATTKMKKSLGTAARGVRSYDSLERCWSAAFKRAGQFVSAVILFSPGARSTELFANEFQRGEKFNALVKEEFR